MESEKRMGEKMAAQMEEYVKGRFEDVKGEVVTSTPGNGTKSKKVKVGRDEKRENDVSVGVEKMKKKRTSKNRRYWNGQFSYLYISIVLNILK